MLTPDPPLWTSITRDGKRVRLFRCPVCKQWADIDDDQFDGFISIDHTPEGCTFHETINVHNEGEEVTPEHFRQLREWPT